MSETVEVIDAQTRLQDANNKRVGYIQGIVLLLILGILFAIIFGTLASSGGDFLLKLKDIEIARGLITFLVVVTAISIALILAVYVLASNEKADQIKERFTFAKDVLAILVGILGTVLGFYYGTKDKNEDITFAADAQFRGTQMTIHVTGATPPYRYTITFPGEESKKSTAKVSKDGWVAEAIPNTLKKDDPIQVEFVDSKDKKLAKVFKYSPEEKPITASGETTTVVPPTPKATPTTPEKVIPNTTAPVPAPKAS